MGHPFRSRGADLSCRGRLPPDAQKYAALLPVSNKSGTRGPRKYEPAPRQLREAGVYQGDGDPLCEASNELSRFVRNPAALRKVAAGTDKVYGVHVTSCLHLG